MQNFVRNLLTEWRKLELAFDDETFVVAISGGADSVSLTLGLRELKRFGKLNLRIVIAHFNHNLRGDHSDEDENFVKNLAGEFGFELALGSGNRLDEKGNLEQNARDARYQFLVETAENVDASTILTAHTMNDQAETFLFNLIRGSGLEGLGGMKPSRSLKFQVSSLKSEEGFSLDDQSKIQNPKSKIRLVRPLLSWAKREDTENFCRSNEIEFRYDSMNEDLKFNRVRIRKVLLPLLKDFNPKIIETLAKTAELLREDFLALNAIKEENQKNKSAAEKKILSEEIAFEGEKTIEQKNAESENQTENLLLKDLSDIFPSIRRMILRDWLKARRGSLRRLEAKHFEAVEKLVSSRKSGRLVELPDGEAIVKEKGRLVFQKRKVEK